MARPLPQRPAENDPAPEPKLEVVAEPPLDEPVEVEEKDPYDARAAITQDPLKLYVRQIGDGRAAHAAARSASSPAARTPATRRPSAS